MGQLVIRNLSDRALSAFRSRAKRKSTSLEKELRDLIERHAPYAPAERLTAVRTLREQIGEARRMARLIP
jgi:plasmid stability protein